jgi:hypothetical protein
MMALTQLGRASDVRQSMDKDDLIAILYSVLIAFAFIGGYYLGRING